MATGKAVATGMAITADNIVGGSGKRITSSTVGQQTAVARAMRTANDAGVTHADVLVRYLAANGPLWAKLPTVGDFGGFMCGPKSGAIVHSFAPSGTACRGGHDFAGSPCKATRKATGKLPEVATWRTDATFDNGAMPAFDASAKATITAALAWFDVCIGSLAARGASVADMLATPGIAYYVALAPAFAAIVASAKVAKVAKASAKATPATPATAPVKVATARKASDAPKATATPAKVANVARNARERASRKASAVTVTPAKA